MGLVDVTWLLPALGLVGVYCSTYDRDGEEAMKHCRALLSDPDCDRAVRRGYYRHWVLLVCVAVRMIVTVRRP